VEPVTTIGIGAITAYLGKDGLTKILGPTADYLGGELKVFTQKRVDNIGKIFSSAEKKLGDKINEQGAVSPKVLKTIVNEGSYSEDEVAVEYFGGVLASSRTDIARDDRGSRVAKTLDNLSCYQLRAHYLIYSSIAKNCSLNEESLTNHIGRKKCQIFLPLEQFAAAMEFTQKEWDNPQLLSHIFNGLSSDGLIADSWGFGPPDHLKQYIHNKESILSTTGLICEPTIAGIELFLWGFGLGDKSLNDIFNESYDFTFTVPLKVITNVQQVGK